MYDVPNKGTIKHEIMPHLSVSKRGYDPKKMIGRKLFNAVFTSRKPILDGLFRLRFHDVVAVVREQHALQPLALAVVSVSVFLAVAHSRLFTESLFCLVFSKEINIISALFVHQSLTLPQKTDSREGLF